MKTIEEIVARYEEVKNEDWMGTIANDLLIYIPRPLIDKYINADVDWKPDPLPTDEKIVTDIREYLPFAQDKADGERGLSASRSIQHFTSWLWLIGDEDLLAFAQDPNNYPPYGKPILNKIEEKYGVKAEALA